MRLNQLVIVAISILAAVRLVEGLRTGGGVVSKTVRVYRFKGTSLLRAIVDSPTTPSTSVVPLVPKGTEGEQTPPDALISNLKGLFEAIDDGASIAELEARVPGMKVTRTQSSEQDKVYYIISI